LVSLECYLALRDLRSFPTRRSSDLSHRGAIGQGGPWCATARLDRGGGACPGVRCLARGDPLARIGRSIRRGAGESSPPRTVRPADRKSTRLNSSHVSISYAVFCLQK